MVSIRQRLLVSTLIGSILLTLTTGLFLSIVFSLSIEKQFDSRLQATITELVGATKVIDGQLLLKLEHSSLQYTNLYSGWYWQIIETRQQKIIFQSKSLDKTSLYSRLSLAHKDQLVNLPDRIFKAYLDGPVKEPIRVYGQHVSFPELDYQLLFIVSGHSEILKQEIRSFYSMIAIGLSLLVAGLTLGTFFQLRFVLKPLTSLKNYLAKIRIGEGSEIEGGLPVEIMPVADEINNLINANKTVIERARTHVGNLAHALKTPISVLMNASENKFDDVSKLTYEQVSIMNDQITHHLNRARMVASLDTVATKILVSPVVLSIISVLEKINFEKKVVVNSTINDQLCFYGEHQDLEELIGNILDNAFKWCEGQIDINVSEDENTNNIKQLYICVEDDGRNIPDMELKKIIKRGHRIDENVAGSGLGLSIVKELVQLYNGEFQLSQGKLGGLKVELWLPLA